MSIIPNKKNIASLRFSDRYNRVIATSLCCAAFQNNRTDWKLSQNTEQFQSSLKNSGKVPIIQDRGFWMEKTFLWRLRARSSGLWRHLQWDIIPEVSKECLHSQSQAINYLPVDTAQYPRRLDSWATPMSLPQILHCANWSWGRNDTTKKML